LNRINFLEHGLGAGPFQQGDWFIVTAHRNVNQVGQDSPLVTKDGINRFRRYPGLSGNRVDCSPCIPMFGKEFAGRFRDLAAGFAGLGFSFG
jgi:hypothetical protein